MDNTQLPSKELLSQFRSPAFPGSYFLSFEGIEGAGKSTQIIRVKEYLESNNFRVLILREPGGTSFGEKLRGAVLNTSVDLHPVAEAHLFASSRAQLLTEVILKELNSPGTVIICDRYLDSSIAYQGFARKLGTETILSYHKEFPLNLVPHKTFYIRIDVETSYGRQKIRNAPKDYFESQGEDFYKSLVAGYDQCSELFQDRIKVINGNQTFDQVFSEISHELDILIQK